MTGNAGEPLSGVTVATFLDPYTSDTAGDFQATINWGDGTINVGTIVAQANGVYSVIGDHTYAVPGSYTVSTQVVRVASGQTASTSTTATDREPEPYLRLHGRPGLRARQRPIHRSGFATTRRPTFSGTSAAYGLIQLFAQPVNVDKQIYLGETVADSSGNWSMPTGRTRHRRLRHHGEGHASQRLSQRDDGSHPQQWDLLHRLFPREGEIAQHHQRVDHRGRAADDAA